MSTADVLKLMGKGAESPVYQTEKVILDFTERICEIMEDQGTNRSELAARLGRSRAWVTKLLRGDHNMTIATMVSVMMALGYEMRLESQPQGIARPRWEPVPAGEGAVIILFPRHNSVNASSYSEEVQVTEIDKELYGNSFAA